MEIVTGMHEFKIHLMPAYSRYDYVDGLRLSLAIISGRVPYIKHDEILLLGLYEDPFNGYVEVNEKIRVAAEDYIYDRIEGK